MKCFFGRYRTRYASSLQSPHLECATSLWKPTDISLRLVCSSPRPSRLSTKFMSRHRKYTHHSELDARHTTVNLNKQACVTITLRLVQQPAIAGRHVHGSRLAITHTFGKRPCQRPLVNTAACHPSKLVRVHGSQSGESYLVDTGAEISLRPPTDYEWKFRTRGPPLRAANNTDIAPFGERNKSLKLGTNTLCWKFNMADVSQPILGADIVCHHGLLVEVRRRRLINPDRDF